MNCNINNGYILYNNVILFNFLYNITIYFLKYKNMKKIIILFLINILNALFLNFILDSNFIELQLYILKIKVF